MKSNLLLFVIILGVISINIYNISISKSEEQRFVENGIKYNQANQLLEEGETNTALDYAHSLYNYDPNSFHYNQLVGLASAYAGNVNDALNYYQTAIDINPFLVENEGFLLNYARFYLNEGHIENGVTILNHIQSTTNDEDILNEVESLLSQVDSNLEGERNE